MVNLLVTIFLTFVSGQNYPGGTIGTKLENRVKDGGMFFACCLVRS